eukprot:4011646-Pleurochrysis_carterae.AAC.3
MNALQHDKLSYAAEFSSAATCWALLPYARDAPAETSSPGFHGLGKKMKEKMIVRSLREFVVSTAPVPPACVAAALASQLALDSGDVSESECVGVCLCTWAWRVRARARARARAPACALVWVRALRACVREQANE